jgi:predicted glycoside hydrolase/deacetylase ChbG (UPF0249 family)
MKYLIVNGDDFGAGSGINRGILEAHQRGILTSASLMVNSPSVEEAVAFGRAAPQLSVGLHVDLRSQGDLAAADFNQRLRVELRDQVGHFRELMGRLPTHLDSHHNVHCDRKLLPEFLELAREHDLPLRGSSLVRPWSRFYGQWGGETHLEQISAENLVRMLATEIEEGVTELICHPGYGDRNYATSYSVERETELRTLCDPLVRRKLAEQSIQLVSYHDLASLLVATPP